MSAYRKSLSGPTHLPTRWEFFKKDVENMLNVLLDLVVFLFKAIGALVLIVMIISLLGLLSSWTVNGIAGQYYGQWYHHAGAWFLLGVFRLRVREPNHFER